MIRCRRECKELGHFMRVRTERQKLSGGQEVGSDQRTRKRAHELWEQDGLPEGREREHWEHAAREIKEEEAERDDSDRGALKNDEEVPAARVGSGSGLQPGGTTPGGGPGTGMGSIGTGGGSTGGASTGAVRKQRR